MIVGRHRNQASCWSITHKIYVGTDDFFGKNPTSSSRSSNCLHRPCPSSSCGDVATTFFLPLSFSVGIFGWLGSSSSLFFFYSFFLFSFPASLGMWLYLGLGNFFTNFIFFFLCLLSTAEALNAAARAASSSICISRSTWGSSPNQLFLKILNCISHTIFDVGFCFHYTRSLFTNHLSQPTQFFLQLALALASLAAA